VTVVAHDPMDGLADTGTTLGGVPVRLNAEFLEADVRIGISCVMPHPFAGFSGGAKIVVPGLAGVDVVARTHKFALMGLAGGSDLASNRFRREMEQVVRQIGLHWTVNVAVNADRQAVALMAGDLVGAHRAAATAAAAAGATPRPAEPLDALILNAYPKDGELLQVEGAFVALRRGMLAWLRPGAPIVLTAACTGGMGQHGLFGPGGTLFRSPSPKTFLGDHPLLFYSPGVDSAAVRQVLWEGYRHFTAWHDAVAHLQGVLPAAARVGVVPTAPLQLAGEASHAV
jgi:nickel-dependent lactate racemase